MLEAAERRRTHRVFATEALEDGVSSHGKSEASKLLDASMVFACHGTKARLNSEVLDDVASVPHKPVTQQIGYCPVTGCSITGLTYFKVFSVLGSSGHINLHQLHVRHCSLCNISNDLL